MKAQLRNADAWFAGVIVFLVVMFAVVVPTVIIVQLRSSSAVQIAQLKENEALLKLQLEQRDQRLYYSVEANTRATWCLLQLPETADTREVVACSRAAVITVLTGLEPVK